MQLPIRLRYLEYKGFYIETSISQIILLVLKLCLNNYSVCWCDPGFARCTPVNRTLNRAVTPVPSRNPRPSSSADSRSMHLRFSDIIIATAHALVAFTATCTCYVHTILFLCFDNMTGNHWLHMNCYYTFLCKFWTTSSNIDIYLSTLRYRFIFFPSSKCFGNYVNKSWQIKER